MRDWCFRPECLRRFQDHWVDADVEERPQAGHYVILDEPEVVIPRIREFLRGKSGGS